jgi:hypothetical protein
MTTTRPLTQPEVDDEATPGGVYDDYLAFVATLLLR